MKKALLLLLTTATLACKKDKKELSFPLTLYAESAEATSITRVYTESGEIKDAKKIAEFTKNLIFFNAEESREGIGSAYLTFQSPDSVIFGNNELKFAVKQSGNQFLLTSKMLSISPKPLQDHFRFHLLKYKNVETVGHMEVKKEVRVAYGTHSQLKIPILAYHISSLSNGNNYGLFKEGGLVCNEFNEGILPMLGTHDTIAVKTYILTIKAS